MDQIQQNKSGQEDTSPARKQARRSAGHKAAQAKKASLEQAWDIFASLPEGVIVCDCAGKITCINPAARTLFEVSDTSCRGKSYQDFLSAYKKSAPQHTDMPAPWLMDLVTAEKTSSPLSEKKVALRTPSGRDIYVKVYGSPLLDGQRNTIGTVYIFLDITYTCHKALQLAHVHQALLTLIEATARIPEKVHAPDSLPEGTILLSPPVQFIVQQLIDLIAQILDCDYVALIASGPPTAHLHFVAGSGFSPEQERYWREMGEQVLAVDILGAKTLDRLYAGQEVILSLDHLHVPYRPQPDFYPAMILLVPLFFEQNLAGTLDIVKRGADRSYAPEEVELVKAVATQTMLVIECLHYLARRIKAQDRELVLEEVHRLSNEFLVLASHELRTPLTGVMGHIQLARRRLEALKQLVEAPPEILAEHLENVQNQLDSATRSAQIQQRMISDMIDDARIQANQLELNLRRCELISIVKETVTQQQPSTPERTIRLEIAPLLKAVLVMADAKRIGQVIKNYLVNALKYSAPASPVTVRLNITDTKARVSVHNEGPGIPPEEQERLWERFYRARGSTAQHELDLSLGLGLYLCQALIERHHGEVGVESVSNRGTTFWFTLPIISFSDDTE